MLVMTATKSSHQLVAGIARIDRLDAPSLVLQERRDIAVAEAREPVPMLHHDDAHLRVGEQLLELGPLVVEARGNLGHLSHHLIAARRRIVAQALHLAGHIAC